MEESGPKPQSDPTVNAMPPQKQSDQKTHHPHVEMPFGSNRVPSTTHKGKSEYCRPDQTPLAKHVLEVIAVGIGACYTLAAIWQLGAMKSQLAVMQDTIKLERPWIGPTERTLHYETYKKGDRLPPFSDERFRGVGWHFKNGGRTVATRVHVHLEFEART
jgi:hypothetical protein